MKDNKLIEMAAKLDGWGGVGIDCEGGVSGTTPKPRGERVLTMCPCYLTSPLTAIGFAYRNVKTYRLYRFIMMAGAFVFTFGVPSLVAMACKSVVLTTLMDNNLISPSELVKISEQAYGKNPFMDEHRVAYERAHWHKHIR